MSAFRLLSRSTKLHKNSATPAPVDLPPSLRPVLNSQACLSQPSQSPPKKRKLGKSHDNKDVLGQELEFFNKDTTSSAPATSKPGKLEAHAQEDQTAEQLAPYESLPVEESRRILKSHKIKITTLWESSGNKHDAKSQKRKRKSTDLEDGSKLKKQRQDRDVEPATTYAQLRSRFGIHRRLAENLANQGYTTPTEIQMGSLPILLGSQGDQGAEGVDLLSIAPTGSGKTLAFLIPTINGIKQGRKAGGPDRMQRPEAIIVAPTKELASQIVNEARKLAANTGIKVTLIRKGMKLAMGPEAHEQEPVGSEAFEEEEEGEAKDEHPTATIVKSAIVVSTPGTMLQALSTPGKERRNIDSVRYLILDEADVLLDPLFRDQTLGIWKACTDPELRVSFWSATMGASIEDLVQDKLGERYESLPKTVRHEVARAPLIRIVVGLKDSAVPNIHHQMIYAANEQGKLMGLRQLLRPTAKATTKGPALRPPFLVFTQTIERAVALHSELSYDIPAEAGGSTRIAVLHSDLSESSRDRIMTRFRKGEIWVMITTDLLSRGVDFRGVNGVVNYDFPNSSAAYIHRVGRTGRAGREGGVAVTLYAEEDIPYVKNVANVIAASEKLRSGGEVDDMTRWLVESLPKTSKRDKQRLKKRGIESRRPGTAKDDSGKMTKSRISTKSGSERKEENKKKGAIEASKARKRQLDGGASDAGDGFEGFD